MLSPLRLILRAILAIVSPPKPLHGFAGLRTPVAAQGCKGARVQGCFPYIILAVCCYCSAAVPLVTEKIPLKNSCTLAQLLSTGVKTVQGFKDKLLHNPCTLARAQTRLTVGFASYAHLRCAATHTSAFFAPRLLCADRWPAPTGVGLRLYW